MSSVLYYSNYCNFCKELLSLLSRSKQKDEIHFICIDRRVKKNGVTYIQLQNGQEIILPPNIRKVPSLLLINRGHMVLEGYQIREHLQLRENEINQTETDGNGEPQPFGINEFGSFHNSTFSYLEQSPQELMAQGEGGMKQLYNYATLNHMDKIETPPDNYTPNKVKEVSLDQLQQMRERDVPKQPQRF